jgi:RNA polymerase sigma factor (sigma-70 family)
MCDEEIVARIAGGDLLGLGEAYDRYATALYAYCRSNLCQPADAADAVQDTFVVAALRLGGLRDPSRLRPWLYAVARNECLRRQRSREIPAAEVPETAGTEDVTSVAEQAELAALVRAAAEGVDPAKREVLDLQLRDLDAQESALVLGVSRNSLHARLSRARDQLETSVAVLLVARYGRGDCGELGRMLEGWNGRLTPGLRKQLGRHLDRCEACHVTRLRRLSPAVLAGVGALPVLGAAVPAGLRQQVLHAATSADPAAVSRRAVVARHAGPFGRHGFPGRVAAPRWWQHPRPVHVIPAAALVSAGTAAVVLAGGGGIHFMPRVAAPVVAAQAPAGVTHGKSGHREGGTGPVVPAATASPVVAVTSASPGPRATHRGHVTATASPSPSASASSGTPSPSPSRTPVIQGTLTVSTSALTLIPLLGSSFTITADGGPVSWSVSEPASILGNVVVSPLSGTLQAGQAVTVTVTLSSVLSVASSLTVSPGGEVVTILAGAGLLGGL